jgi:ABC-type nitrate/sulfonate/bicarbonate transport system ATPase subunit
MTLTAHHLGFSYDGSGGDRLFNSFDLGLQPGPNYALLGFSGTGKSTLLKLLGGLLAPLEGEVTVPVGRTFGYVPQEPSLLPWLTVGRNLSLGAELLGDRAAQASWRAELASKFALEQHLDRRPSALSGGMKQRAAVISALTSGANTLLLDEPFAGSDRLRKKAMFDALGDFEKRVEEGIVLFTTHDAGDVFATGATAIWLDSMTRQATMIAPAAREWDTAQRERLLDLMISETM